MGREVYIISTARDEEGDYSGKVTLNGEVVEEASSLRGGVRSFALAEIDRQAKHMEVNHKIKLLK
jgi:hypothetical protein